jgi:hypothetical protein
MAASRRQGAKVTRANLRLDSEQYKRLLVFSVMENRAAGEIVSALIREHLRGWSMPGKIAARGLSTGSADTAVEVESASPAAA